MTDTPKRRRLTAEARREMIARAALALFAERGYERTTTREIARVAGVSEGTIFKYFPTKRDLLFAFFTDAVFTPLATIFTMQEPIDDGEIVRAFIAYRFAMLQRHHQVMKVLISEALFHEEAARQLARVIEPALQIVQGYLERRVRDGVFRPMNTRIAGQTLVSYVMTYFFRWVLFEPERDHEGLDALIDEITSLYLYGVTQRPEHPHA